ncbi:hypothetical protein B0G80_5387 [Paraburkholderia sp. BL6669N2]|uniref:hypothetical protein n=1 Tax=Paraburkholderia sp. BL6669N2 TaxID=1938807 RepID=UPI000E249AEF|nr:hypothetical protein [Paraburkholderia sp. BL6669N2]REG49061.1 hypothetical protein B0G80_5387 [Paraburkholderia sp. BL6669N2]
MKFPSRSCKPTYLKIDPEPANEVEVQSDTASLILRGERASGQDSFLWQVIRHRIAERLSKWIIRSCLTCRGLKAFLKMHALFFEMHPGGVEPSPHPAESLQTQLASIYSMHPGASVTRQPFVSRR